MTRVKAPKWAWRAAAVALGGIESFQAHLHLRGTTRPGGDRGESTCGRAAV